VTLPKRGLLIILIGAIGALLCGCLEDEKQQLAKCELGARVQYKGPPPVLDSDLADYMKLCMRAAGYEWDASNCAISVRDPKCYISTRWVEQKTIEWQTKSGK
jgi:hypothetical protein